MLSGNDHRENGPGRDPVWRGPDIIQGSADRSFMETLKHLHSAAPESLVQNIIHSESTSSLQVRQ